MAPIRPNRPSHTAPVELHARAMDSLRYIRQTIERAGSFTAVPGAGGVFMGSTALLAALVAGRRPDAAWRLEVWLAEAVIALLIGIAAAARKSRRAGLPLFSGPGRKFLLGFAPPMLAGALLTAALFRSDRTEMLPGLWLLLYGASIVSGGAASVRVVPVMGACFMALGTVALMISQVWGNLLLAAGFGGLHILFGIWITVNYGG